MPRTGNRQEANERAIHPDVAKVRDTYLSERLRRIVGRYYLPQFEDETIPLKSGHDSFYDFLGTPELASNVDIDEHDHQQLKMFLNKLTWNPKTGTITLLLDNNQWSKPTSTASEIVFMRAELGNTRVFSGIRPEVKQKNSELYRRLVEAISKSCLQNLDSDLKARRFVGELVGRKLLGGDKEAITAHEYRAMLQEEWKERAEILATELYVALTLYFDVEPSGTPFSQDEVVNGLVFPLPWYMNRDRSIKRRKPGKRAID